MAVTNPRGPVFSQSDLKAWFDVSFMGTKPPRSRSWCYFIHMDLGPRESLVKVGCSGSPTRRLKQLRANIPHPLRLLGVIPGGYDLEREMHEQLADHRQFGEWFRWTEDVERFVHEKVVRR